EAEIPVDTDPCEVGDLLAPQARRAATASGGQPHGRRGQALAPRSEKIAELVALRVGQGRTPSPRIIPCLNQPPRRCQDGHMKAAVLEGLGAPLVVRELPDPVLGTGEVIVDVAAANVLAYAGDVFSGKRGYLLTPPVVPGAGAIGRVRASGADAAQLAVGDWV